VHWSAFETDGEENDIVATAWLFPGQGSQAVGMGKALYDHSAKAREIFLRADESLGWSLSKICFEGPSTELVRTPITQPAILTASIAALAALKEAYPDLQPPTFVAGHSLGEYSALVAAGTLKFEDAVRLVHLRGTAMQDAVPIGLGAMAAVIGGTVDQVVALCDKASEDQVVSCANFNAPGQVVIGGHATAVDRARRMAAEAGLKVIPLKVSAPFHCSLMAPAAQAVRDALTGIFLADARVPVIANVEAQPHSQANRLAELLVKQVDAPVLWEQSVRHMAQAGVVKALEIGPGTVLAGLVQRTDKRIVVHGVNSPEGIEKAREFLN
jgi:[acyl-carrier-protein] S-malonyltransferase